MRRCVVSNTTEGTRLLGSVALKIQAYPKKAVNCSSSNMGPVAEWLRRRFVAPVYVGSNPTLPPNIPKWRNCSDATGLSPVDQ